MTLLAVGIVFSPMAASAFPNEDDFLNLKKAVLDINDGVITDIIFKAQANIPEHPGIDWGYGIITLDESDNPNVIATTSHPNLPIVDSILQTDAADDVIHNHYVILGVDPDPAAACGQDNPFVADLTFKSPGKIFIDRNEAILKNLPESVLGGNFNTNLVFIPGTNYQVAASFQLEYVDDQTDPNGFKICIVDVRPLDPQEQSTVIIGEKEFFDHKQTPHDNKHDNKGGYDLYVDNKHRGYNDYAKDNNNYGGYDNAKDNNNYGGYDNAKDNNNYGGYDNAKDNNNYGGYDYKERSYSPY